MNEIPKVIDIPLKASDDEAARILELPDRRTLLFFVQGSLADCDDVMDGFDERKIRCRLVPEPTIPLASGSMIVWACDVPKEHFEWALDRIRRHPKTGGIICTPGVIYSKEEKE